MGEIIISIINNCEKAKEKFKEGSSQHTLLQNRLNALYISKSLIEGTDDRYSVSELKDALNPIFSIINKCEKAIQKYETGSTYHKRLMNIINAMHNAKRLIIEEIDKRENEK